MTDMELVHSRYQLKNSRWHDNDLLIEVEAEYEERLALREKRA